MGMDIDCGMMIRLIDDAATEIAGREAGDIDLTLSQIRFVYYLGEQDGRPVTMRELEDRFGVAQPTVAGIMKKLEHRGMVSLDPSPVDRRAKVATLTERGLGAVSELRELRQRVEDRILAPLDPGERPVFKDMLRRLCEGLDA